MWQITGIPVISPAIDWNCEQYQRGDIWDDIEGVRISLILGPGAFRYQRLQVIKTIESILERVGVSWLIPDTNEWVIDLDELKRSFPELPAMDWFRGKITLGPEFELEDFRMSNNIVYYARLSFYILPETLRHSIMLTETPVEIQKSLSLFRKDYPGPTKIAFVMMQFGKTNAHNEIIEAIKEILKSHNIIGVRADDKQYHDDLLYNVLTYLYGCSFGIAVFERIEEEEFNPNVSFEVGYMSALGKSLCLLKDKTLKTLPTDLIGKLYKEFDPQSPLITIPQEVSKWLSDKQIV